MTFEEAVKIAIQQYWDEEQDDDMPALQALGKRKYTKQYMNGVAEEYGSKKKLPDKKKE